jgi:hypothetical protein
MNFESVWRYISTRNSQLVQERCELEPIFDLAKDCSSYLEVGTAEGNTLFAMSKALRPFSTIAYVDLCEPKTEKYRNEVIDIIKHDKHSLHEISGNSHDRDVIREASYFAPYDMVFIDAGHLYEDALADAFAYGQLARKYIVFHDICMPEVSKAFDMFVEMQKHVSKSYKFGSVFGYGVIKL